MRNIAISLLLVLLSACTHLPEITPVTKPEAAKIQTECEKIFPQEALQLLHRIQASLPNGKRETLLGITQIYPEKKQLHCVLMTIEGLVLLEAAYENAVSIQRAVPPFDKKGVAEGMLADIRLIFFKPVYNERMTGIRTEDKKICRYELLNNQIEEIVFLPDKRREIHLYSHKKKRIRSVLFQPEMMGQNLARQIKLTAHGFPGYQLNLTLLKAESL